MKGLMVRFTQNIEHWAVQSNFIYQMASIYYKNIIRKEIDLASITADDRVLCIGGGVCPFSAILLHQSTGAHVTVIDNDSDCVKKALQVINNLNLEDHINVILKDGGSATLNLSEYTVIHLALQVSPMDYVVNTVEENASPGTKLLIRRPKKHLCKLYCRLSGSLLAYCRCINHNKASNIECTLLYIKEGIAV